MPSKSPAASNVSQNAIANFAQCIRQRRVSLGISTVVAAHAAGFSRVTWHRIENAEASVTMGAYIGALEVLGLDLELKPKTGVRQRQAAGSPVDRAVNEYAAIPATIAIQQYAQLRQIAWHVKDGFKLTPAEAFGLYQRNRRHLEMDHMEARELSLYRALEQLFLEGVDAV